jgi:hypothetical protein
MREWAVTSIFSMDLIDFNKKINFYILVVPFVFSLHLSYILVSFCSCSVFSPRARIWSPLFRSRSSFPDLDFSRLRFSFRSRSSVRSRSIFALPRPVDRSPFSSFFCHESGLTRCLFRPVPVRLRCRHQTAVGVLFSARDFTASCRVSSHAGLISFA